MKRVIALLIMNLGLALWTGCTPRTPLVRGEPLPVSIHSSSGKSQIRWVNEISATSTLFTPSGLDAFREMLIGKDPVRLYRPYAVQVDNLGRVYLTDPQLHLVHLFDARNREYRAIRADSADDLVSPLGLANDADDNLYITDSASGRLYRYRVAQDRFERFSQSKFDRPTGIAFDKNLGRLLVVDTLAHQVVVLDLDGKTLSRIGSRGDREGQFNYPTDIAVDKWGRILVNDTLNSRIQVFRSNGEFLFAFGAPGSAPGSFLRAKGIATDSSGAIYVSDALTDMIQVFNADGRQTASFGQSGAGAGEFWMPAGLFIDQEDKLYAVDSYNKRVQIFDDLFLIAQAPRSKAP